jgi:hypothetical protein
MIRKGSFIMTYEFYDCGELVKVFTDAKEANDFVQHYYDTECYSAVIVKKITDEVITFDLDIV